MTEPVDADQPGTGPPSRSRTLLVTFLGAVVRRMGHWMPIAGTVDLMVPFGLDEASVRTAVSRLKKRDWLASESRAGMRGYSLTPHAHRSLAAGDEIVWHARQPADLDDGWCVVTFSVPETARARRQQLRSALSALGFGNTASAVWMAPARMRPAAEQAITELGLLEHCALFVGDHAGGQPLPRLVAGTWDLAEIDRRYAAFTERYAAIADELAAAETIDPAHSFSVYLDVVDAWRRLPYRDPGLAAELLPENWSAPAAGALFERLVGLLEGRALAHAAAHWTADTAAG